MGPTCKVVDGVTEAWRRVLMVSMGTIKMKVKAPTVVPPSNRTALTHCDCPRAAHHQQHLLVVCSIGNVDNKRSSSRNSNTYSKIGEKKRCFVTYKRDLYPGHRLNCVHLGKNRLHGKLLTKKNHS